MDNSNAHNKALAVRSRKTIIALLVQTPPPLTKRSKGVEISKECSS